MDDKLLDYDTRMHCEPDRQEPKPEHCAYCLELITDKNRSNSVDICKGCVEDLKELECQKS